MLDASIRALLIDRLAHREGLHPIWVEVLWRGRRELFLGASLSSLPHFKQESGLLRKIFGRSGNAFGKEWVQRLAPNADHNLDIIALLLSGDTTLEKRSDLGAGAEREGSNESTVTMSDTGPHSNDKSTDSDQGENSSSVPEIEFSHSLSNSEKSLARDVEATVEVDVADYLIEEVWTPDHQDQVLSCLAFGIGHLINCIVARRAPELFGKTEDLTADDVGVNLQNSMVELFAKSKDVRERYLTQGHLLSFIRNFDDARRLTALLMKMLNHVFGEAPNEAVVSTWVEGWGKELAQISKGERKPSKSVNANGKALAGVASKDFDAFLDTIIDDVCVTIHRLIPYVLGHTHGKREAEQIRTLLSETLRGEQKSEEGKSDFSSIDDWRQEIAGHRARLLARGRNSNNKVVTHTLDIDLEELGDAALLDSDDSDAIVLDAEIDEDEDVELGAVELPARERIGENGQRHEATLEVDENDLIASSESVQPAANESNTTAEEGA